MDRPRPPEHLLDVSAVPRFVRAEAMETWLRETFIDRGGALRNPDHDHLDIADIGVLWTDVENRRHMRTIVGMAEAPNPRGGKWKKGRQEAQFIDWFGGTPDFILTFYAPYAADVDDATWCALVEHELYHCGQKTDRYGAPKFTKDGRPKYGIRGHDVEEFIGVVRRYGAGAAAGGVELLAQAEKHEPQVAASDIAGACGTCPKAA